MRSNASPQGRVILPGGNKDRTCLLPHRSSSSPPLLQSGDSSGLSTKLPGTSALHHISCLTSGSHTALASFVDCNTSIPTKRGLHAVEYILLWRDPAKSGAILGAISVAYILLEWTKYSLLQIMANLLLFAVSAAFLWSNLASFTGR